MFCIDRAAAVYAAFSNVGVACLLLGAVFGFICGFCWRRRP